MRGPTQSELPPPPAGRTGWLWAEETLQLPNTTTDGQEWQRISTVMPSCDRAQYLQGTIREEPLDSDRR